MAMEDIVRRPQALVVAIAAKDSFDYLGSPREWRSPRLRYLAPRRKSNAVSRRSPAATAAAKQAVRSSRRKPSQRATGLMRREGTAGYQYDHDMPTRSRPGLLRKPSAARSSTIRRNALRGEVRKRLEYWEKLRRERGGG